MRVVTYFINARYRTHKRNCTQNKAFRLMGNIFEIDEFLGLEIDTTSTTIYSVSQYIIINKLNVSFLLSTKAMHSKTNPR